MHMQAIPQFSNYQHHVRMRVCPQCNGPVERIRRRFIDRVVSLLKPVQRYRCCTRGWDCDWKGTLPY